MSKLIKDERFVIFDTDTTGINENGDDRPIELALVKWSLEKGVIEKPKSWLINPQKLIHPSAMAVHGISDEELLDKPTLEQILPEVHAYIGNSTLVAHNIDFDLDMLPTFKENSNSKLDTLRFAKKIYKLGDIGHKGHDLRSYKSQELRYWMGLNVDTMGLSAHRAAADILVTAHVFSNLLNKYLEQTNNSTTEELEQFISAPVLLEKMTFGKLKDQSIKETITTEMKSPRSYYSWLLKEIGAEKMKIDPDLQYSIEYYLKEQGYDPEVMKGNITGNRIIGFKK